MVQWNLIGGVLRLVQEGGDWMGEVIDRPCVLYRQTNAAVMVDPVAYNYQWRSQRGVWWVQPPLKNVKKISEDEIVENTQR